jgi:hypothetical protein
VTRAWASGAVAAVAIVASIVGGARAGVPQPEHRGHAIGTIRSIDRADNVVTMGDGLRLRAPDAQILEDLREGDLVKVDFAHERGGWVIRTIEGALVDSDPADSGGD